MELEQVSGTVTRLRDDDCTFTFERLRPGSLLVRVEGKDKGQFGTLPIDQFRDEMQRFGTLTLLVDARDGAATADEVTRVWGGFFKEHRDKVLAMTVLVGSKFMELTVSITTHLARMGRAVTVTSDADLFGAAVERERNLASTE